MSPINTKLTATEQPEEGIIEISPSLKLEMSDDDLVKTVDTLVNESISKKEEMDKRGKTNEEYWKAHQLDTTKLRPHQARIVDNRLFLSLETIIPIMTSRTPEPTVRLKDPELRENVKQLLMNLWEVPTDKCDTEGMQSNMEMISRHWALYFIGLLKYEYNPDIDDIETDWIRPDQCVLDVKAKKFSESRFAGIWCEDTVDNLKEMFPKAAKKLDEKVEKDQGLTKLKYMEFHTPDYICYKFQDVILGKKKNPNWDYGDMNETGEPMFNLFPEKKIPLIPLTVFNLGNSVYDDTSLFEQGRTLQDAVNKRKNQISDNANDNGVLIGSGDFIKKKTLESYTGDPREKLFLKTGNPNEAITRLPPKQLAPFVYNDLQDSKAEIDNIFGSHSTTRGEKGAQKTLGEAQLLRMGDMGRIDLFSRALDRVAQEWYTTMLHMYLVYKNEPVEINSNDEEGTSIIFNRNEFINPETGKLHNIKVKVKPGSAMSIDKDSRRAEARELAQAGLIDPITFFEKMDYSNPKEMAMQLFIWNTNPIALFPEMQQQQQAEEEQQMAAMPLPEGLTIQLPEGGTSPDQVI